MQKGGLWVRCLKIQQSLSELRHCKMLQLSENDVAVHFCTFQAFLDRAKVNLRFPSLFFVQWKTINGKNAVSMVGRKRAVNSLIELNETLIFNTEMLYHRAQKQYLKKESLIHLNLISNSRPDQVKLVGRVVIDLSEIANTHKYSSVSTTKLMYCSVDADISFSMKLVRSIDSNLELNELDRSSFSDLYSFTTSLKNTPKIKEKKESTSENKAEEDRRKIKSRFSIRDDLPSDIPKSPPKDIKIENILIKDHIQEEKQQKSLPHSLPLTEKKPPQPLPEAEAPIVFQKTSSSKEIQKGPINTEFDNAIQKQRDSLEKELNQHKNRIKKLQSDIKEVLRLFEQSEQNSELNKSKLLQSEEMINSLKDTEAKVKEYYEKQITNLKQVTSRELNLLKAGYEADIKILKATIEEQRIKTAEELQNNQRIMEDYQLILKENQQLKSALNDQQAKFSNQLAEIKTQNIHFHEEKGNILASIDQKEAEIAALHEESLRLKKELQQYAVKYDELKAQAGARGVENESLKIELNSKAIEAENERAQIAALHEENTLLKKELEQNALRHENIVNQLKGQAETLQAELHSKITELQNQLQILTHENANIRQESEAKLHQAIFQYEQKLLESAAQANEQNAKLVKEIQSKAMQSVLSVNPIDINALENYEKLKQEHNKLTLLLQNLKKSIIFPEEQLRLYQQAEAAKPDLFVIMERSQLQEIEISQLKQENATIRQKMGQLIEEHQQLKSSRNKDEQQKQQKLDSELKTEELALIKQELFAAKEMEASHLALQQTLEKQITELKNELTTAKEELDSLKIQHEGSKQQIFRLNSELQIIKTTNNQSPQDNLKYSLKPDQTIKIDGEDNKINVSLRKNQQSQTANLRVSIEIQNMESLQEPHNEEHIDHYHHDFNFDEHSVPLTHEELNKITEVKDAHSQEINYLRDQNNKLKYEVEELKSMQTLKENLMPSNESKAEETGKLTELQQYLRKIQQQNQSLKQEINTLHQSTLNIPQKPQQQRIETEQSNKYARIDEEVQQDKRVIAQLQAQLNDFQKKYEQIQRQALPNDTAYLLEKENAHLRELEARLANLEQQLKIKDQILLEGEKNLEQNYAIKYELAELKEKYSEIKSALDERDEMINYLEETKEQLSKELEQVAEKPRHSAFQIQIKEVKQEPISSPNVEPQSHNELANEVQALKKELITLNNNNTELRNQIEDAVNQRLSVERSSKESLQRLQQIEAINKQLEDQVNYLSLLINGLNSEQEKQVSQEQSKIEELTSEIQKLSDELHTFQLNYNNLVGEYATKEEKLASLEKEYEEQKKIVEELTIINENMNVRFEKSLEIELPEVKIHQVDSFNQAPPLEYEKSTIPLEDQSQCELKKQSKILNQDLNVEIETLKQEIQKLTNKLSEEAHQKDTYFNNLELSNNKVIDLQVQIAAMKDQIDKMTSLPIQSFAYTPTKNRHHAETFSKNMKETSIMYQPRVRAQAQASQPTTPHKYQWSKGELSKDVETRVETKVINETETEYLQQELDMLKEELESEAKLHHQLKQIHNMCEKKYELLNNHYENCLQQLDLFKTENEQLLKANQNVLNQLKHVKEEFSKLQAQNEAVNNQYKKLFENSPIPQQNILPPTKEEVKDGVNPEPNLFLQFRQSTERQSMQQRAEFAKRQQQFLIQKEIYDKKIGQLKMNEQKLINKINLLEENMFSMERALQQQIEINQANDKISEKLEQLNELQTMAAHFQQELQQAKANKQELSALKNEHQIVQKQKIQLAKALEEHSHCLEERAEWQQKLQNIEHLLMNNESKFAEEKQQLQNKVMVLNEEKASLEAEKSIINQTIKRGSEIFIDNQVQQLKRRENELYNELQTVKNEKLNEMEKVAELEEKFNRDIQSRNQKESELQEALIIKENESQEIKFINVQLAQEIQEMKLNLSERDLYANSYKEDIKKLSADNAKLTEEITALQVKMAESLDILKEREAQIQHLKEQLLTQSQNKVDNAQLSRVNAEIAALHEEITQKIASIEHLENKLQETDIQISQIRAQLAERNEFIKANEQTFNNIQQEVMKLKTENQQLESKRAQLQKEVQTSNTRYSELENAVKNTTSAKDKNIEAFRSDISKKQQEINDLSKKIKSKQNDILNLTKELDNLKIINQKNEQKIQQLAEKEKTMKETMDIIESEAQRIVQSLKARYESEEIYYRRCIEKERENSRLTLAVTEAKEELANKERVIMYEQQKAAQLQNQLEILKNANANSQISPKIVTIQYEKYQKLMQKNEQLMNKNREYLQIISHKNTSTLEGERLKRQIKEVQQKISEHEQNSLQTKQVLDSRIPQLQKQLESANNEKSQLLEKINALAKEIQATKEQNLRNNHKSIETMLSQKDKEINLLKQASKKAKEPEVPSFVEEPADSNISILNEQILNLNREILEKDNELQRLKTEIHKNKNKASPLYQIMPTTPPIDEQKQKLINELQERERRQEEYKASISKLKEELKKGKSAPAPRGNMENPVTNIENIEVISHDLHSLCEEIKSLCQKRTNPDEADKLFQSFVQKYDLMEEQFNSLNSETSVIQEKAKFISKELQKIKSFIIKGQNRAFKEKTELLALIKPCELAASELVNISETLSDKQSQNYI